MKKLVLDFTKIDNEGMKVIKGGYTLNTITVVAKRPAQAREDGSNGGDDGDDGIKND
jgi:hypothetical protein